MKQSRFTEEQIIGILKEQETGVSVADLCRKHGVVIPPFLTGRIGRIHAAIFSFWAGVMPPMPMLGRSLL